MIDIRPPFNARLSRSLISIMIILLLLKLGENIFIPMAFAALLTIVLLRPANYFEKKGFSRGISSLVALLLTVVLITAVLYFISSQIISFRKDLPAVGAQLSVAIGKAQEWIRNRLHLSSEGMQGLLDSAREQTLSKTGAIVSTTVSSVSSTLLYAILIPIYTFLLLLYRGLVVRSLVRNFLEEHTPRVYDVLRKTRLVIRSYVAGLLVEMLIVACLNCAGFFIIGVKYALLLGVLGALLNLVPYLGIFTAMLLGALITSTTNSAATVLGLVIVLIVVHLIDSNILLPRIVGSKVRINALAAILGVVAGEMLWGIPGMFLAVPIVAILKVIFDGVDGMEPWGILLGDDGTEGSARKKK